MNETILSVEGTKEEFDLTILTPVEGRGYVGTSHTMTVKELINKLIEEGILEDGESVWYEG